MDKIPFAQRINQAWRLMATALGFVMFGLGGVVLGLCLLPDVWRVRRGNHGDKMRVRRKVMTSWHWFTRYLMAAGIVEARFEGFEKLGRTGQLMLANHPSLLDVVFILSRVPQANCIIKADLLRNPAMRAQILACQYLPNTEDMDFVEKVDDILSRESLLVFPEGTRTGWDGHIAFHRGAVSMGLRSATVITPIIVKMTPPNFKKNQPWYKIPLQKPIYEFRVGDDIFPSQWLAEKPLPIAARRLNDYLQHYFNEQTK